MAIGISQFYPETARWIWGLFLWGGIALMAYGGYLACKNKCKIAYKKIVGTFKSNLVLVPPGERPNKSENNTLGIVNLDGATNVIFSENSFKKQSKKIRFEFKNIAPERAGSSLYMQFNDLRHSKNTMEDYEKSKNCYQYSKNTKNSDSNFEYGVRLIGDLSNGYGHEINGWVEIDFPQARSPRKEFRFRFTGIDTSGEYIVDEGSGAFVKSPNPICGVLFCFMPGVFISGKVIFTQE